MLVRTWSHEPRFVTLDVCLVVVEPSYEGNKNGYDDRDENSYYNAENDEEKS